MFGFDINARLSLSSKYFRNETPYGNIINNLFIPKHDFRNMWYIVKHIDSYSFCIYFFKNFNEYNKKYSSYDYCINFNISNLSLNKKWLDFLNIKYDIQDGNNRVKISYLINDSPTFNVFKKRIDFLLNIDSNKYTNNHKFRFINDSRNDFFKMKQVWNLCIIFNKMGYFNK